MQKYTPYANKDISICNLTEGKGSSKDATEPPLMRVAKGSWLNWAASATSQCQWGDKDKDKDKGNDTLPPGSDNLEKKSKDGLIVRVKVCETDKEEANCKSYTADNGTITKKPTGLLQKYWESDKPISFGLMTGSWGNNQSGGMLRATSHSGSFEVDPNDGKLKSPLDADGGIIATLDHFRISGYNFEENKYDNDKDWGNPLSEIYLEALRYLAGKGTASIATDDAYGPEELKKNNKSWQSPINNENWCSKCSIIAISSGANSYDTDELGGHGLVHTDETDMDADTETKKVGTEEDLSGDYLISSTISDIVQCTGKTVSSLAQVQGICPEAPSLKGGYHIAGLAYYARTNDFFPKSMESANPTRPDEIYFKGVQSINTYSVALSENSPRFEIPVDGGTISIHPACEAYDTSESNKWSPCSMTDLRVESIHYDKDNDLDSGSLMIVWEDATSGSDYDMDGIERLEFSVSSGKVKIITSVVQTDSPKDMRFGYTISGSDQDIDTVTGVHNIKLPVSCPKDTNCNAVDKKPTEYGGKGSIAKQLENPLWYAAKYGGFETIDTTKAETPALQSWDEDKNEIPDAFFKATNPALLESALDKILNKVASNLASSASVAANSTRLDTTAALYQAKFSPATWNGQLLAYQIDTKDGSIASEYDWDAGKEMTDQGSGRSIFGYNDESIKGIDFVYGNLSDAQKGLITEDQLDYIKGDQSKELPKGPLRQRTGDNRLLGDIVNSDPEFISSISQGYEVLPGDAGKDYLKYITSPKFINRAPMLAVGANDGMLHVFNASLDKAKGGKEILAYVPSTILGNLKYLTLPTYIVNGNHKFFVDGSPVAGDAYINVDGDADKEWRTALVGTLGAGGKGIFALDLTFLSPGDGDYKTTEESFSASRVLWEINDKAAPVSSDLTDDDTAKRYGFTNYLGVTMGQASIVRMANGDFAAVFGNGYNSKSQTAVLYIVDIKTGHLIRSITTGVGDTTTVNGLATPLTVDINGDRIIDAIYAGDYLGNMWKFDVSDKNKDNWKVAFTSSSNQPVPLFKAISTQYETGPADNKITNYSTIQRITAKPEFARHPNGGIMLYFGTGKYFLSVDNDFPDLELDPVETFYGIWDECLNYAGGAVSCSNDPINETAKLNKSQLEIQTIDFENVDHRVTSSKEVKYPEKKGWYMDLFYKEGGGYITGEKVISQAIIRNRRIFFSTIYPDTGECVPGGNSWLMSLDALTGNKLDVSAFILSAGDLSDKETPAFIMLGEVESSVSGIKSKVGMIDTPAIVETDGATENLVGSGSSGRTEKYKISKPLGGRQSWLQIR